jgi:hypothetical protein
MPLLCMAGLPKLMWVAVADCCLLKLKLSPTPGLPINCRLYSAPSWQQATAPWRTVGVQSVVVICDCSPVHCGSPIDLLVVVSSNSSVASPLRAATERFVLFLVCCYLFIKLKCCLFTAGGYQTVLPLPCCFGSRVRHDAPAALRGLFFLVGVLLALRGPILLVDMLLPVVHSAVTSPLLPSFCRVHCPYLLLSFL